MTDEIKAYLDAHYPDDEPTEDERYHISMSKFYALIRAGLIKTPPLVIEVPCPELDGDEMSK